MAGNLELKYETVASLTCAMASTAAQHGRISASVTNTVDLDQLLTIKFKTSATAADGNKQVIIYALGSIDAGTTVTDGYALGDADTAVKPTTAPILKIVPVVASTTYIVSVPLSVAFGGLVPSTWAILVFNDQAAAALDATSGNFLVQYQGQFGQYT